MKSTNTLRGEKWTELIKIANELRSNGDEKGAEIVREAAIKIGNLK